MRFGSRKMEAHASTPNMSPQRGPPLQHQSCQPHPSKQREKMGADNGPRRGAKSMSQQFKTQTVVDGEHGARLLADARDDDAFGVYVSGIEVELLAMMACMPRQ